MTPALDAVIRRGLCATFPADVPVYSVPLTSHDRFLRMLERRDHDRVPRHDGFWPETIDRWQREGFTGDWAAALRLLPSDINGVCWSWPVPFPGHEEILSADAETKVVRGSQGKTERVWLDHTDGDVRKLLDFPDHSVPPQVSWQTYRFIIQCVEKCGNY